MKAPPHICTNTQGTHTLSPKCKMQGSSTRRTWLAARCLESAAARAGGGELLTPLKFFAQTTAMPTTKREHQLGNTGSAPFTVRRKPSYQTQQMRLMSTWYP
jgi:hypothetical protein